MIRAIVIAVCSTLSRAADDDADDGNHDEPDDGGWRSLMMSLMSDVMAWVIVLCEQYPSTCNFRLLCDVLPTYLAAAIA